MMNVISVAAVLARGASFAASLSGGALTESSYTKALSKKESVIEWQNPGGGWGLSLHCKRRVRESGPAVR